MNAIYTYKIPADTAKACAAELKTAVGVAACQRGFGGKADDGGMIFYAETDAEKIICTKFGKVWNGSEYK